MRKRRKELLKESLLPPYLCTSLRNSPVAWLKTQSALTARYLKESGCLNGMDFRAIWVAMGTESSCPKVHRDPLAHLYPHVSAQLRAGCAQCPAEGLAVPPWAPGQMCLAAPGAQGLHRDASNVWLPWGDAWGTITDLSTSSLAKAAVTKVYLPHLPKKLHIKSSLPEEGKEE